MGVSLFFGYSKSGIPSINGIVFTVTPCNFIKLYVVCFSLLLKNLTTTIDFPRPQSSATMCVNGCCSIGVILWNEGDLIAGSVFILLLARLYSSVTTWQGIDIGQQTTSLKTTLDFCWNKTTLPCSRLISLWLCRWRGVRSFRMMWRIELKLNFNAKTCHEILKTLCRPWHCVLGLILILRPFPHTWNLALILLIYTS